LPSLGIIVYLLIKNENEAKTAIVAEKKCGIGKMML
jgi:hypothetical protein